MKNTGFFHIMGSNTLNKVISSLSGVILVRVISKPEYGVYTYADNILNFFLLFTGLGMVSGILQICSEYADDSRKSLVVYKYGGKVAIGFNVLMGVVIFSFSFFVTLPMAGANRLLMLSALIPCVQISAELKKIYLRYTLQNQLFSYINVVEAFLLFVFSLAGAFMFRAQGLVLGRFLSYLGIAVILVLLFRVPLAAGKTDIQTRDRSVLYRISLISMCNNGMSQLLYLLDVFCIGLILTNDEVIASYKVATVIPIALDFIPQAVVIYIYPYFAMHRTDRMWVRKNFIRTLQLLGLLNMAIALVMLFFAPLIITLIFGAQYLDAVIPFRILAVEYFFKGTFRTISGNLLTTQRRLKFNFANCAVSGVINIVGNVVLISMMGSVGAAISTLITAFVSGAASTVYMFYILRK